MWYMMNEFGTWGWLAGGIGMLLFWGIIIALVIWGVTKLSRRDTISPRTPLEIVKERYAMGEVTKEQFEQIERDL